MKQLSLTISATVLFAGALFAAPIHDAAREGDIVGIQAQLDAGADVNAEDERGWVPHAGYPPTFGFNALNGRFHGLPAQASTLPKHLIRTVQRHSKPMKLEKPKGATHARIVTSNKKKATVEVKELDCLLGVAGWITWLKVGPHGRTQELGKTNYDGKWGS
jgi:hypothetical protein